MNEKIIYKIIDGKGENRRLDKRYVIFGIFVFIIVATISFLATRDMAKTSAADLSKFKAGNIMSDSVMRYYGSMTEAEIQTFLKKKNTCGKEVSSVKGAKEITKGTEHGVTYNYQYAYGGKTYHYHVEKGKFVCLNEEKFNSETAAHIIYQAAQDYKINPQVLIVLLEKEQGLITDKWPNTNYQYRSATGYGCPDTAACDSKYYGFKNQVRNAAAMFNTVLSGGWTNYPLGWNEVRYSPNASCGSSKVYIENLATSALYRYTPYQPNAAALKAGTGSATCGAYGNRNFYIYFTDWFGSTQKVQYTYAQTYYNKNKNTTGKLTGEVTCVDANNKTADLMKDGTYYCYQDFEKGTLFWNTTVKNTAKTESGEIYLDKNNAPFYKGVTTKKDLAGLGKTISGIATVKTSKSTYQILPFEKGYIKKENNKYSVVYDTAISSWAKFKTVLGDITSEKATLKTSGLIYLACANGYLVGSDKYGYYAMPTGAFKAWTREGNEVLMGKPTEAASGNTSTNMKWQKFENGYIMGNDQKGWYPSTGKTREIWRKYNFESGKLSFIQSDISTTKNGATYQKYTGNYVVCIENDCKLMPVGVFTAWTRGDNEKLMGKPTAETSGNSSTKMQWQAFENGYIMGNDQKGWYPSTGKTREIWRKYNFESGKLSFIQSDISTTKNGATYQKYTGNYVVCIENDCKLMPVGVFTAWTRGDNEKLMGKPTAETSGNSSTKMQWQAFENGYIMGNDQKGWYPSTGKTREIWKQSNYEYGTYGFIKSDITNSCQEYYGGKICVTN